MLKVELHAHTSDDPADRIPHSSRELIDRAALLGYDALAITLHDRQLADDRLTKYAADRGVVLIPGIERTVGGRHVLLLNFSAAAERVGSFDDIKWLKQREPGIVIAPHPFFPASTCLGALLERHADVFDAVECNAMFTSSLNFNRRAEDWARAHRKPMVANGDIHRLYQLGTSYSLVEASADPQAICDAVRSGRVTLVADPISGLQAAWTMADLTIAQFRSALEGRRRRGAERSPALLNQACPDVSGALE